MLSDTWHRFTYIQIHISIIRVHVECVERRPTVSHLNTWIEVLCVSEWFFSVQSNERKVLDDSGTIFHSDICLTLEWLATNKWRATNEQQLLNERERERSRKKERKKAVRRRAYIRKATEVKANDRINLEKERLMNIISLPIYWTASKHHKSHTPTRTVTYTLHTYTHAKWTEEKLKRSYLIPAWTGSTVKEKSSNKNKSLPFKFNNANGRIPKVLKHVCRCIYSGIPVSF